MQAARSVTLEDFGRFGLIARPNQHAHENGRVVSRPMLIFQLADVGDIQKSTVIIIKVGHRREIYNDP